MKIDPATINDLDDKNLMDAYSTMEANLEELKAGMTEVRRIFQERLKKEGLKSSVVNKRPIVVFQRVMFKTTTEQAEELGAVETIKKVNTKKLRMLYDEGVDIPGVQISELVRISQEQS